MPKNILYKKNSCRIIIITEKIISKRKLSIAKNIFSSMLFTQFFTHSRFKSNHKNKKKKKQGDLLKVIVIKINKRELLDRVLD